MNINSTKLFNFLNNFVNNFNIDNFDTLDNEFKKLLTVKQENNLPVPAKSFFTFDQQRRSTAYRPTDQDFNKNYEFVFSGCSQTHGDHITKNLVKYGDHNNIWGFQIAKTYNKEALNLGMGGRSAQSILKGLMHHFQQNGNPRVLLVLYPDFGRLEAVDSDKIKMQKQLNDFEIIQHWYLKYSDDYNFQKISKSPHDPEDVIPWTLPLYNNLQSILFLQQYCKTNNIYFKYFSWDYTFNIILKLLKNNFIEYSNYCEPEHLSFSPKHFKNIECHLDIKNNYSKEIWNHGIDKEHIGIHQHIHIAETFIKELKNDNPWN